MLLFWALIKRLNKVIITELSRFLLFLRAYYVQKGILAIQYFSSSINRLLKIFIQDLNSQRVSLKLE